MKKKPLTQEEIDECAALRKLWDKNARALGVTQEKVGQELGGKSQSAVGHYLGGRNALNIKAALVFARMINVKVEEFSPRLSALVDRLGVDDEVAEIIADIAELNDEERQAIKLNIALLLRRK